MDEKIGNSFFCVLFELKNVKGVECVWGGRGGGGVTQQYTLQNVLAEFFFQREVLFAGLDSGFWTGLLVFLAALLIFRLE